MAGINWPGLFAWSTKYHDGTAPSQFKQMTDEDRKFLEKAMEEAFGKIEDPNKIFQGAIEQIKSADRTDESISTALEIIDRCCDDPDVARNVEKLDGMQPLLDLAVSPSHQGAIHLRTLEILVLLWSNNPAIQEVGMRRGGMRNLLVLIQNAPRGSEERAKAFAALVALMRQVETFEVEFLSNQTGVALLVDSMSPEEAPRMREKALSFVRSVTGDGRLDAADAKPLSSAVACLLRDAKADFAGQSIQYRETLAGCLLELALQFPEGVVPELVEAANARMEQLHGANNSDDEVEMGLFKEGLAALAVRGGSIATERICGRWMHKGSGRSFHVKFAPPKSMKLLADGKPDPATMLDDATGEPLYQRADDTAEALKSRLDGYFAKTVPILEHYGPKGIVRKVDANQAPAKVREATRLYI